MKTIGQLLSESRRDKNYSREDLEDETKIKKEFIKAIEKENWGALPDYPVVNGFVKSLAATLGVNQDQATALLRRDYPPQNFVNPHPKPDVSENITWSPKLTFALGVLAIAILFFSYLGFQYFRFSQPPEIKITDPQKGQVISASQVEVKGKTSSSATLEINNQPVLLDKEGNFSIQIEVFEGTKELVVKARSRAGRETIIVIPIEVKLDK